MYAIRSYYEVKEDPNKPGWPQIDDIITEGAQMRADYAAKTSIQKNESRNLLMIGGQEGNYPSGEPIATCCGITPWTVASNESAAEYYAHFIKEAYGSGGSRITSYNVCYTKLLRLTGRIITFLTTNH